MQVGFGSRLKELIEERGFSQKQFASKCEITEAAVSRYVKGERIPRSTVLSKMADVLGTSSDYLLNGAPFDSESELAEAYRLIARNASQMTKEQKLEIVNLLINGD